MLTMVLRAQLDVGAAGLPNEAPDFSQSNQIRLTYIEATPIETTLPTILPTARIPEVEISLQYKAKDNVVTWITWPQRHTQPC